MMGTDIILRPSYWANVSGGKDSLYMLKLILANPDRYPLDGVVHYELDIDFPFIKDVVDYMEVECKKYGVQFVRIKPRKTWEEWYYTISNKTGDIYGFPTRMTRWCNSRYKMDAEKQLHDWMKSLGCYVVHYIGYCLDEGKRYSKRGEKVREVYPLVENGIVEDTIWEWAKTVPQYNNYYKTNRRCGCMYCPLASYIYYAYLYKYYPDNFAYMIERMRETETLREKQYGRPYSVTSSNPKYNADYLERIVKEKWLKILEEREKGNEETV